MAQLSSPGVSVTVIDESFYTPAAPGTTPLIIVASEENKLNGAGTGTAPGTLKANAGKVYLLTSQRDLSDTFGTPKFITDANNNPVHAGEQNEYGLQAAYSYLGVSNRAYVVRADVNLGELSASTEMPAGDPADGTYWFNTGSTSFGVFEWNGAAATVNGGQTFVKKVPLVITDATKTEDGAPKASVGAIGSYAIVSTTTLNKLFFKNTTGVWVQVGTQEWISSWPTAAGTTSNPALLSSDTLVINGYAAAGATTLAGLVANIGLHVAGVTAAVLNNKLALYTDGSIDSIEVSGTVCNKVGLAEGTYYAPKLNIDPHTKVPAFKATNAQPRPTGSIWVKTTEPNAGASFRVSIYNEATGAWSRVLAPIYNNGHEALKGLDASGGGINLPQGALYVKTNDAEASDFAVADFKIYRRNGVGATTITSSQINSDTFDTGLNTFTMVESLKNNASLSSPITVTFIANGASDDADAMAGAINAAGFDSIVASVNSLNQVVISHLQGGDFRLEDGGGSPLTFAGFIAGITNLYNSPAGDGDYSLVASQWKVLSYTADDNAPTALTADQAIWYNSNIEDVDMLVHDGDVWRGYRNVYPNTDPLGPTVAFTAPTTQQGGAPLVTGDLWISTADLENYPLIYKFNGITKKWILVDNSDQSTEDGILFHDARWDTTGKTSEAASIAELLTSDFVDFDCPDPALYPKGMLLWNLRRSGFNVKQFVYNYVDVQDTNPRYNNDESMEEYYPHRWISIAANQPDGAGTFGRKAQRAVVIQALAALINSNQQIRDEEGRIFNLLSCPGYPEVTQELIALNYDRGISAFVVADTPARLTPDATSLSNWGNNTIGALVTGDDGLTSSDEYLGFFYPWGYTTDNIGNNIAVPPSHMILRTIALSDNVSYPWFAPAGTRRGGITNASAVGYITSEGEFQSVALNTGQRDTLASIKVNPITFITGTGLVNYGQYTRARNASALDRINVARLIIYLRRQFNQLAKPYVFEPNDTITRNEIKQAAESLLLELVGQRALYDFLVVCDSSNNTPARIDRSELYLDVAIEPVKAAEFIYIPLRLKNTGEIKGLS